MNSRLFAFAAVSAVALVPAAHGTVRTQGFAQPQTTAPPPLVDIRVTLTDTRIVLDRHNATRGDYARFIVHNVGTKRHTFTLGTAKSGTAQQTGFSRTLKPKEQKILILFLDYRGKLPYRSVIPADRTKSGMKGIFEIL